MWRGRGCPSVCVRPSIRGGGRQGGNAAGGCAGRWRGLEVAIKTLLFQSSDSESKTAVVASEAAIASNLVHHNIVATYTTDVCSVVAESHSGLDVFKFYLIQARPLFRPSQETPHARRRDCPHRQWRCW